MSSAETIAASKSLNPAINARITASINEFLANDNIDNNYYMINNNSSFRNSTNKIDFIKNLNEKITEKKIVFSDANSNKYGYIILITVDKNNIYCTYTNNDSTTGKNKKIYMGNIDNYLLNILIIRSNTAPNIRLYSIFSQYTFESTNFSHKTLINISIDKFNETFFNISPPRISRQNARSQHIIATPASSKVQRRMTATEIIAAQHRRLSTRGITPGQMRRINSYSNKEKQNEIDREVSCIYARINRNEDITDKINELYSVIIRLQTMETSHYTHIHLNLIITEVLKKVIVNGIKNLRGRTAQTQELNRIIAIINGHTEYTITDIKKLQNDVITIINAEKQKKRIRDKELMPPPSSTSKRQKTRGGSKIITRKIYINNEGKSFIKFNKNLIIYLK